MGEHTLKWKHWKGTDELLIEILIALILKAVKSKSLNRMRKFERTTTWPPWWKQVKTRREKQQKWLWQKNIEHYRCCALESDLFLMSVSPAPELQISTSAILLLFVFCWLKTPEFMHKWVLTCLLPTLIITCFSTRYKTIWSHVWESCELSIWIQPSRTEQSYTFGGKLQKGNGLALWW